MNQEATGRPELLKILCILTFIGSGISLFSYSVLIFTLDIFRSFETIDMFGLFKSEEEQDMLTLILHLPRIYFILHALLYAFSLFGAYLMWNLKKLGFHFYSVSQILLLIVYKTFIPDAPFPIIPLSFTAIFIILYYSNLRFMR